MRVRAQLGRVLAAIRQWVRPSPPDREVDDEITSVVELLAAEKRARGVPTMQARREALWEIGGREQAREAVRADQPRAILDRLRQDWHDGLRLIRRAPLLSGAVIVTLALGTGATSATFSVVDGVLLKPLPYPDADRLVAILHRRTSPVSPANFLDWQRAADGFSAMGAAEFWTPTVGGVADPERIVALRVTPEVLPLVGVAPSLGRFPRLDDPARREVVISDGLWRRALGADPAVLGRSVPLDGLSHEIVGVMPPGFVFAPFWATRAELWAPLDLRPRANSRGGQSLRVFARLAPGTSLDQARHAMAAVTIDLETRFPGTNRDVTVTPLKELVVGETRPALVMLSVAVLLVLLIGCANIAHLLLVRASAREREVALRAALGASRRRLVRQFLAESLVLTILGGLGGVLLAAGAIRVVKLLGTQSLPRVQGIVLDERVVAFALVMSLATVLIFAIAPTMAFARPSATGALRSSERGTSTSRGRRLRRVLIASEVALAILLLAGASLLLRSFVLLRGVDAGWTADGVASFVLSVAGTADDAPDRRLPLFTEVLDHLRVLPGVQAASAINHLPIGGDVWGLPFRILGQPEPPPGAGPAATYRTVLPGYFDTMRLPLVRGRDFTPADRRGAPGVVIVNERLAERHFPGEDAIGRQIRVLVGEDPPWRTIVGVAKNALQRTPTEVTGEEVYLPLMQNDAFRSNYLTYVIRTGESAGSSLPGARTVVRALAPRAAIADAAVMTDVVHTATRSAEFTLVVISAFAGLALLLAAIGIYSVMSYGVELRRREIGIRLALGARPSEIVRQIAGEGLLVTAIGGAVGLALAVVAARLMVRLLFGVTPFDAPSLIAATAVLIAAAAVACLVPARRASRIDPQAELR